MSISSVVRASALFCLIASFAYAQTQVITVNPPNALVAFQQTVTASAASLPSNNLASGLIMCAKTTNAGSVYFGPSGVTTSTGAVLPAGACASFAIQNSSSVYIVGTAGDIVSAYGN